MNANWNRLHFASRFVRVILGMGGHETLCTPPQSIEHSFYSLPCFDVSSRVLYLEISPNSSHIKVQEPPMSPCKSYTYLRYEVARSSSPLFLALLKRRWNMFLVSLASGIVSPAGSITRSSTKNYQNSILNLAGIAESFLCQRCILLPSQN